MIRVGLFLLLVFLLAACKVDDCATSFCANGSICLDGNCECREGYHGENCEFQSQPSSIIIESIRLNNFARRNGTRNWDSGSDSLADIVLRLFREQTLIFDSEATEGIIPNARPDSSYLFPSSLVLTDDEVVSDYLIEVLDIDQPNGSEVVAGLSFRLYHDQNNFSGCFIAGPGCTCFLRFEA